MKMKINFLKIKKNKKINKMAQLVTMSFEHLNVSVQTTDYIYYVKVTQVGTLTSVTRFDTGSYNNIIKLGYVFDVDRENNRIKVFWDDSDNDGDGSPDVPLPTIDDFILFSKSKPNNTSSLVGYYALANFVNNSNEKIELFSVGSEISLSSK